MKSIDLDATFHLLIPSRFPPIALYERIAGDHGDEVASIESLTNPRLAEKRRMLGSEMPTKNEPPAWQNWNHAPFAYPNPNGTRFFGPDVPALELADDLQTALAISVERRARFLGLTNEAKITLDMRAISRRVKGSFLDARDAGAEASESERLAVGGGAIDGGFAGVLFTPRERPTGGAISVLNNEVLGRAVQGEHFNFVWDGGRIRTIYSFAKGREIDPNELAGMKIALAA